MSTPPPRDSEIEKIKAYEDKGFTASFKIKDDKLVDNESGKSFTPDQVSIIQEYRHEGVSNPSDMSITYVVKTDDNTKGTVTVAYGVYGNTEMAEFFKSIPDENNSSDMNTIA